MVMKQNFATGEEGLKRNECEKKIIVSILVLLWKIHVVTMQLATEHVDK